MNRTLLPVAACLAALSFAPLRAQAPAPKQPAAPATTDWATPTLTLHELERDLADASRQTDAALARLGGGPWRAADPAFASATAWRDAVLRAPRLTPAQILAQAERPRLRVRWSETPRQLYGPGSDVYLDIIRALEAQGRRPDATGAVALEITLTAAGGEITAGRGARVTGRDDFAMINAEARLLLPVRVLRGEAPHSALAAFAHGGATRLASPPLTREIAAAAIQEAVARVYAHAAELSARPAAATDTWAPWLADAGRLATRQAAFRQSHEPLESRLGSALAQVAGFRSLTANFANLNLARGTWFFLNDGNLHQWWMQRLNGAGFDAGLPTGPALRHEVALTPLPGVLTKGEGLTWVSRVALHDDDCLAVLGGRFVRVAGDTHLVDSRFGFANSDRATNQLRDGVQSTIDALLRQLGPSGARAGLARHKDGDAVAAYLRSRQLVPVPDAALAEISHRIAFAFGAAPDIPESVRREFITEHQGNRTYDLARIGTMRQGSRTPQSLKAALSRVINDLTIADPIGFAAFYDIWNHDRGYRRPELPADFAQRFARPRPSGAGALSGEKIVPAIEIAYRRLDSLDYSVKAALRVKLAAFDAELRGIRLLACDYIPANGKMNYVETRTFFYETEPKGWPALAARLPAELNIGNIGPALRGGPDTLAEADKRIAARR